MAVSYPLGRLVWSKTATLSGAGTYHSGPIDIHDVADLWLAAAAAGTSTGTNPTLGVQLDLYDNAATPNLFPAALSLTSITAGPGEASASAGLHGVGSGWIVLPMKCQVTWVLGGTNPVFPAVTLSLFGR